MRYGMLAAAIGWLGMVGVPAAAQEVAVAHDADAAVFVEAPEAGLEWAPLTPPGFDEGMELSVVQGDPSAAEPYVVRLRFPDGYRFPPHFHPNAENLTVLEGSFQLAMGETADDAQLKTYAPGDFLYIEGKHPHFGGATGTTVVQLHGSGPFEVIVVGSPEDKR